MTHRLFQLPQRRQVHSRSTEVGAACVPQPLRTDPYHARALAMHPKDPSRAGLGHRVVDGRSAQRLESLDRVGAARAFVKPVVGALDDEAAMDRCDTVTVSLADHTHLAGYMSTSSRRSDRTSPVRSPRPIPTVNGSANSSTPPADRRGPRDLNTRREFRR